MRTSLQPSALVDDPRRLKALAHPTRLALLEVLAAEPEVTATRCAKVIGESVASCSFHLRTLARHGFIEEVVGPGREKPWRLTNPSQVVPRDAAEMDHAADVEALADVFIEREMGRIRTWRSRAAAEPAQWRRATTTAGTSTWLTSTELEELGEELKAVADRYLDRLMDPNRRPDGARRVRIFMATTVEPDIDGEA
ncbi:helix-turn-helix domain-containing protein [Dactylosporangium sp. NPDC050588]|uniref:helix-turn-helix domain-containing protein n=1 Tax=Dactylosporangium sp. NPDC050588 TaxID=3157211 RepID=UPI0033D58A0E